MVKPVTYGKRVRMSYSRIDEVLDLPDLIEVQRSSYDWFINEGLDEVLKDISPIEDYTGSLVLEFVSHYISDQLKYDEAESRERDATYSAPLKVKVRLINKDTGEIKEQEVFMGDLPLMTSKGTFIINGAERVVVSQLVRSPGVYYKEEPDKTGKSLVSSTLIPNRGAWLDYETDSNDVVYVRIDRTRKTPITVLLRILGIQTNSEILELLGDSRHIEETLAKDATVDRESALIEVYKKQRPGEPPTLESAESLINNLFFDHRRYDLAKVGRYKFNKKLSIARRIEGQESAEDIINNETGELLVEEGQIIEPATADLIELSGINRVVLRKDDADVVVIGNNFVDLKAFDLPFDPENLGLKGKVYYPKMKELLENYSDVTELEREVRNNLRVLSPKHITVDDIIASVSYQFNLFHGIGIVDDIDHLGNRRVRSVGELLQNQFRIG
ncbi:MAG: DNA-directed RNA polymerase subunit beta, partial [Tissierellia bacterium]|nr:DNA-directed RNA polymerase subunit beta [Tissierellia bacterium]